MRNGFLCSMVGLFLATQASASVSFSSFNFSGTCSDCAGIGTGTLVLANYTLGNPLQQSNFVSFSYSSNLLPSFSITTPLTVFSGQLTNLPSANNVVLTGAGGSFESQSSGFWCVATSTGGCDDFGFSNTWTSAVPEPASAVLVMGGMAALAGLVRIRRRSRK